MDQSSSKGAKAFVRWLIGGLLGGLALSAAFIAIADPYRNIPFSPPMPRPMMDINQRWMFPGLARDPGFDGAIFGTSSIRVIEPERVEALFGGRVAQLGMYGATAWEQMQLANLYLRHHPHPRMVFLGLDTQWCQLGKPGQGVRRDITSRGFPDWMYDENPWNDLLYLFNNKTLEVSGRIFGHWILGQKPHFDERGYLYYLPPDSEYDIAKVRTGIYGTPTPHAPDAPKTPAPSRETQRSWTYPDHPMLTDFVRRLPDETKLIMVFIPYHSYFIGHPESENHARMEECKRRVTDIIHERPNTYLIDFMIPSTITTNDFNYWDPMHFTLAVAQRMTDEIVAVTNGAKTLPDARVLVAKQPTTSEQAALAPQSIPPIARAR